MATYVLLPGAGGESWYWHLVVPELHGRGHEVIAVDFPAADEEAGLGEYADVVVEAIGGRTGVILVAQSMGAYTAPLVCERIDVEQIVLVAPMIPTPGESPSEFWEGSGEVAAAREMDEREGRDPDAEFDVVVSMMHDLPQELIDEAFARGEPKQADKPFEEPFPLDAWPDVPTRVIAGRSDRLFPLEFMRGLARERLGVDEVDVIDTGHLPALSRPAELAERLEGNRPLRA